jgi:hypothetical protein
LRGEILLKRDPANRAPAEDAFLAAIAIAQQQSAVLSFAQFWIWQDCINRRSADAHALLASALKGFSPTPEFPGIEEAQTLLTAPAS